MGTSEEMTKEERIEYWEMVLEDFNQSGLNKTCYCQNNVSGKLYSIVRGT